MRSGEHLSADLRQRAADEAQLRETVDRDFDELGAPIVFRMAARGRRIGLAGLAL